MEMRAVEDIAIAQDLTPPLPPLSFSLYDSFLSSHCASCSLPLPTPPFTPIFPPNYSHVPIPSLLYCSSLCSSLDSPLHFSSAEHHLFFQCLSPSGSHPDSANLRVSLRLLHLFENENVFSRERMGGLVTNYQNVIMAEGDENGDDEFWRMVKEGARDMGLARRLRDGSDLGSVMAEAVMCLVMMNAVEVQEKNGRPIGIAVYNTSFSWINHSCSPNSCYRFSTGKPETGGKLQFLISPATTGTDGCGAESLGNTLTHHKSKFFEGNGPRIIVRSIKGIKKGEEVTIAYTDLLQPKATRQSELWLKYRFNCCCERCRAMPATYVDSVLQETSILKEEEIEKLKDCFDDAIAEYLSFSNPESCCEKLEKLLIHCDMNEQSALKDHELWFHLLHHLSLDAYMTLASAYKVRARDLLALDLENSRHQVGSFNNSRAGAAYSLLLAVLTHHLFLSESSLIASAANYWGSAGESILSVARSSVWESSFALGPAFSETSSFLDHKCYSGPQLKRFSANLLCSQDPTMEFEEASKQFQNCIANSITKTWSFLTHEVSFLKQINDIDFSHLLTMEAPSDSETILAIINQKRKRNVSGSELDCSNQLRGNLFQLGMHCLLYGALLSSICYGQHSELVRNATNILNSEGIFELLCQTS